MEGESGERVGGELESVTSSGGWAVCLIVTDYMCVARCFLFTY